MPELGEIEYGKKLGYKQPYHKHIWSACSICGEQRWVNYIKGQAVSSLCRPCAMRETGKRIGGKRHHCWKGGRKTNTRGYVTVYIKRDDFFFPMSYMRSGYGGYVQEHRLVMARHLGRCLHCWEIVHHKNRVRDDNRIENLQLVSDDRHRQISILESKIRKLEGKIIEQDKLNRLLQWQIKQR